MLQVQCHLLAAILFGLQPPVTQTSVLSLTWSFQNAIVPGSIDHAPPTHVFTENPQNKVSRALDCMHPEVYLCR